MSDLSDSDSSLGEDEVVFTVQEVLRTGLSILLTFSYFPSIDVTTLETTATGPSEPIRAPSVDDYQK